MADPTGTGSHSIAVEGEASTISDTSAAIPNTSVVTTPSSVSVSTSTTTLETAAIATSLIASFGTNSASSNASSSLSDTISPPHATTNSTRSSISPTVSSDVTSSGLFQTTQSTAEASTTSVSNSSLETGSSASWLSIPTFAGVVAGSFFFGAFVAGLLVFGLLKKRSKRSNSEQNIDQSRYSSHHDLAYVGEKGSPMVTVTTLVEPSFLPQQAEDAEVKKRILSLTDQIDQHVENFYHNRKIKVNENVETKIDRYETRQMPNSLAACFEFATHPSALIKHCLAFHIFSRTIAPGEDTELILPTDIAGMVSAMYNKCLSPNTPRDLISAFSLWKSLTGYLRAGVGEGMSTTRTTSNAAIKFATQFGAAFSAWSDEQYSDDHRNQHLAALVNDAIDTGAWLFRQPDNYRFNWNMLSYSGRNSIANNFARETVIVPGVSKMTHKGEPLSGQGQSIVHAVVKSF